MGAATISMPGRVACQPVLRKQGEWEDCQENLSLGNQTLFLPLSQLFL
jgi:hypothetical protein